MVTEPAAVELLVKHPQYLVASTPAQEHLEQRLELQAQPILAAAAAAAHLVQLITLLALVVQELALLGIGVRNGALCKN
jgi:hypothetical protein